jgi:hypothetical protein
MAEPRIFKCVPLDPLWTITGSKLDLKAIYRRPRRSVGEYDEIIQERGPDGLPLYDITSPLPLRRHSDWQTKGFEYVTVVSTLQQGDESFKYVADSLRKQGLNPADYLQHPVFGTWNPKLYLATAEQADRSKFSELTKMVEQFGSAAVTEIRKQNDPTFTLPPALQGIEPGGTVHRASVDVAAPGSASAPSAETRRAAPQKATKTKAAEVAG